MRLLVPLTLVVVVALAAVGGWAWQHKSPAPAAAAARPSAAATAPPLTVDVHIVAPEPFEVTVPATGTLLARESVQLVSELSRRLVRIRAEEGAKVKKGAVLFELDTSELLAELKRIDVQIRLAQTNSERQKALLAEGLTTRQLFDTTEAELEGLNAQRNALGVTLGKATIRAPFSGTMGLRHVSEGAWVSPSTVLASLHDISTLKLDFTLPERYAASVQPGRDFRFKVAGSSEVMKGKILAFEPAVEASSRSVLVRGVVENASADLLPGTFATVELPLRMDQSLLIPPIAVIPGADGRRVFVVRDGVVKAVGVELGARTIDRVQVLSGLAAGDRVAVSNLLRIRNGAKVTVRPKVAAPAEAKP
jgi:membrane fusion protein, multidrug efflux system